MHKPLHISVLGSGVVAHLKGLHPLIDCTLGAGGHMRMLLEHLPQDARALGLDRDAQMLKMTRETLQDPRVTFVHGRFGDLERFASTHIPAGAILADLGVSSFQFDEAKRGFSLLRDGPLDMRMDTTHGPTAAELLMTMSESEIRQMLWDEADERQALKLSRTLKDQANCGRLKTTLALARVVRDCLGMGGKIDPATRTFQALRRRVNDEGGQLSALLDRAPGLLKVGGRLAVISFHSGEDRAVKQAFAALEKAGTHRVLTDGPVGPDRAEAMANPRSRSAKLRVIERLP
ncbi:MAG: 16S rRNA (cytosine(1402)-N(4))-methyltransferase RsmH [Planctomycetota bacterium]